MSHRSKTLQPAGDSESAGAAIVLADPEGVGGVAHVRNAWHVTSPSLPDAEIVAHP